MTSVKEACGMKDKVAYKPAIKIYVANKKDPQLKGQIKILGGIYNE